MSFIQPLPDYLVQRHAGWRSTRFAESQALYKRLAEEGQSPRAMIVSCCDSRVNVTSIFGDDPGEFFVHRNVANIVPPYAPGVLNHGTSAAVQYAVEALKVAHLIVLGHSGCGGVKGCYDMCSGNAPELEAETNFVGRWVDILRPGFDRLPEGDDDTRIKALEREGILVSLENLMTFPFVKDAVENGTLSLHGLWNNVCDGSIETYSSETGRFTAL